MKISSENIVYYLIDKGLVSSESVVDGDFLSIEKSCRNLNLKIILRNHPCYFIKQIKNNDEQSIAAINREAACYKLAENDSHFSCLKILLPKLQRYDNVNHILVTELLKGENLSEYHYRIKQFPQNIASLLGKTIGTIHYNVSKVLEFNSESSLFPKTIPWIFSIHNYKPYLFNELGSANLQMIKIIQNYKEYCDKLDELRNQWRIDGFIHGDMKWDNCIVTSENSENDDNLKIVDWELADFGDSCWDVGAIFQAYISFWIFSIQFSGNIRNIQFADFAQYPLEKMQPAILTFWKAYTDTLQFNKKTEKEFLRRSMKYSAVRMIQTSYESLSNSTQINDNVIMMLQVSLNILKNPDMAIEYLLNI